MIFHGGKIRPFIGSCNKNPWCFLFLAGLFFFVALGCHSRAGLLGITVALVCFSVVAWRCYGVNWARLGCLGFVYLALVLAVGGRQGGVYQRIKTDGQRDLVSLFAGSARRQRNTGISPQAILVKSAILFCKSNFRNLILKPDGQGFTAMDGQGNLIPLVKSPSGITSLHPEYGDLNIELKMGRDGQKLVHVKWPPHDDVLALTSEGFRILAWGIPHESETPKVAHIFSRLDLFSNRAYIWSLSIPMLKDFSLVGQGFGAFALYFPQRDFNGKRNLYANHEIVIEKPHNMYLQYALGGGLPFLGFFLLMAFYICYRGAKTLFLNTGDNIFLPALLSACIGYLAAGFFNDSTIFVAPLFWVLLGIIASISVPRGRKVDALEDLP